MDEPPTNTGRVPRDGNSARDGSITLTTAFELLARPPRRRLLYWLHGYDGGSVSVDDLAEKLDTRDVDVPGYSPDDAHEVLVAMRHVHLPKLDATNVVEYDEEAGTISYVGDPCLDDLIEWSRHEELEK